MKRIAHRGYRTSLIKENTMDAFINAFNNDFDGIEFDVQKTKDNKLVICHNSWISLTSNGSGLISEMTYEDLKQYNFGSSETQAQIPLLKDVLSRFQNNNKIKLVELKTHFDLDDILDLIDDDTYFMSFDSSYIYTLKKKYPNLKFGILNYVLNSEPNYNLDMICILDSIASDTIVKHFLNRGIKVFIYGIIGKVNYPRDYENLYFIVNNLSVK